MNRIAEALSNRQGNDSLRKLARDLNVAVGTAEGWVKGWRTPELENIPKIADYLNEPVRVVIDWALEDIDTNNAKKGPDEAPIIHGVLSNVTSSHAPLPLWASRPTDNRPPLREAA